MPSLPLYTPILILLLAALVCWGGGFVPGLAQWRGWAATIGVGLAALAFVAAQSGEGGLHWLTVNSGEASLGLAQDGLSGPFVLITLLLGGLALLGSSGADSGAGFYSFALVLLAGLLGLYLASGFFLAVIGWSVTATAAWLLIADVGSRAEAQVRAIGATLAGVLLFGGIAYLARLNGGRLDYNAIVPATITAAAPLALLLAAILVGAAQYPLMWAVGSSGGPRWASRGLVFALALGLPELYLALRVMLIAASGNLALPDWWFLSLAIVGGLAAVFGGLAALRSSTASDTFSALAISGSGLIFWAISLNQPTALAAALLIAVGLAAGRIALATGLATRQPLTAILGVLTIALLPPFGGFIGLWLLFSASLALDNRVSLFLVVLIVLLTLPAAAALVAEARKQPRADALASDVTPRRLPPLAPALALIGLAVFSLGLTLAAPLLDSWVRPRLALLLATPGSEAAGFSSAASGANWPAPALAVGLGLGLLIFIALVFRLRTAAPPTEAQGMAAPDVLAPLDIYLRPLRWLQPRTWAQLLGRAGSLTESALVRLDRVLEGRYYILVTALFLLVALLVISR